MIAHLPLERLIVDHLSSALIVELTNCGQVTNSVNQQETSKYASGKLQTMDISPMIAESIRRTHNGESMNASKFSCLRWPGCHLMFGFQCTGTNWNTAVYVINVCLCAARSVQAEFPCHISA